MAERQSRQQGREFEEAMLFRLLDKEMRRTSGFQAPADPESILAGKLSRGGETEAMLGLLLGGSPIVGNDILGGLSARGPIAEETLQEQEILDPTAQSLIQGQQVSEQRVSEEPESRSGRRISRPKTVPRGETWFRDVPLPGGRVSTRQIPPGSPIQEGDYRG